LVSFAVVEQPATKRTKPARMAREKKPSFWMFGLRIEFHS
jgi:hypothetical protein